MRSKKSALLRMDNIGIIVEDLESVIAFFKELGLEIEDNTLVEGELVNKLIGLNDVKSEIVMMRTPDGHNRVELSKFHKPKAIRSVSNAPVNTLGMRRIMFEVADIDEVVARLKKHGAKLVGEIVNYEGIYKLCYIRGPEDIMIALAQDLN